MAEDIEQFKRQMAQKMIENVARALRDKLPRIDQAGRKSFKDFDGVVGAGVRSGSISLQNPIFQALLELDDEDAAAVLYTLLSNQKVSTALSMLPRQQVLAMIKDRSILDFVDVNQKSMSGEAWAKYRNRLLARKQREKEQANERRRG
jgi:hypothetical protein